MKSHSFFTKLLLGNLLLIGLIVGVGGYVSYRRLDEIYRAESLERQRQMLHIARRFCERLWPQLGGDVDRLDRAVDELFGRSPARMTVIAPDGRVLADSSTDPRAMVNHKTPDRPEILEALEGGMGDDRRISETLDMQFRYLAVPVRQDGRIVAAARLAIPGHVAQQSRAFIRSALLWAAAAAVVAAAILAMLLSWIWYAPLRQITQTARTLAGGDLSRRAVISGSDELAQLGTALNEMRDNIRGQIRRIAEQRQNLVAIVENLREGVIGLDGDGCVLLMNPAATDLLGDAGEPIGKHLQSVVRVVEVVDVYRAAVESEQAVDRQIDVDIRGRRSVLDVHAARLEQAGEDGPGVLLVVRDVTHLVRMAAIKAEFVANASHELRTPLATIRAAVDSLRATGPDEQEELRRLAEILDRHTRRLEEMTNDLLSLHLVENTRQRLRPEHIELGTLATWVRDNFSQRATDKGVMLDVEANDPVCEFRSEGTLLQLILQNLVDNAIKFTPSGGRVDCRFDADEQRILLTVSDSGCGIPAEIRDRVFERFFQADSSRSGEPRVRGTGLGLAIVKHAAERLGAQVELDSEPGKGTTVRVRVPRRLTD